MKSFFVTPAKAGNAVTTVVYVGSLVPLIFLEKVTDNALFALNASLIWRAKRIIPAFADMTNLNKLLVDYLRLLALIDDSITNRNYFYL